MFENNWSFERTHTFVMPTNHLPRISGTDQGIWRRIAVIPFDACFVGRETPNLDREIVKAEGPAILSWLVRGYQAYLKVGLKKPSEVQQAVHSYRAETDDVLRFIDERCVTQVGVCIAAKDLFEAYVEFGGATNSKEFGKRVKHLDGVRAVKRSSMFYDGLTLKTMVD